MKSRKIISIFVIAIVSIMMITTVMATVQAVSAAKVKVTWNANGGKIGTSETKVTSVNKGTIAKLPTTPKRLGTCSLVGIQKNLVEQR